MSVYQWLCVLGIPGLFLTTVTGLAGIIRQIRVMKAAMNASLRDRLVQGYRRGSGRDGRTWRTGRTWKISTGSITSWAETGICAT